MILKASCDKCEKIIKPQEGDELYNPVEGLQLCGECYEVRFDDWWRRG